MKIVHIVPGFGGTFYCGNCLRDSALVASLRAAGHETTILPVYLPLVMDGTVIPDGPPVFYGAVSIYIRQVFPPLRKMPGWLHKLLNSDPVLRYAVKKAGSTRAHGMEGLTESMLLGEDGYQRSDLVEIVRYLRDHERPDIVHFSNALLLGMAPMIRREVGVPVVCSLQDEDVWIDAMEPGARDRLWNLMARRANETDALIAVSHWFAGRMKERMHLREDLVRIVPISITTTGYTYHLPATAPRVIGYLSRLCEENGLEVLTDAFLLLKRDTRFRDVRLRLSGGKTGDDDPFIRKQMKKIEKAGLKEMVEIQSDFSGPELDRFFNGLTLISVPVLKGEAFGMYLLESMASGIPVVQPALGAFSEIIARTGGGITYEPNTPEALASALAALLEDPGKLEQLSRNGRAGVETAFEAGKITGELTSIYQDLIRSKS
jgi:glycosyltransferase involved in cell wall biosynthesis